MSWFYNDLVVLGAKGEQRVFRFLLVSLGLVLLSTVAAQAADLHVRILAEDGEAGENAVVSLKPVSPNMQVPEPLGEAVMTQENTLFHPFVLPVTVGTEVTFPNQDEFRHQVYSFSKPKRFELRLYGKDTTNTVTFDKAGVVALGCNIHDNMLAFIYVSEHPVLGKTDESGAASFSGLPVGGYEVHVWHPDEQKGGDDMTTVTLDGAGAGSVALNIKLRGVRRVQQPPAGEEYCACQSSASSPS